MTQDVTVVYRLAAGWQRTLPICLKRHQLIVKVHYEPFSAHTVLHTIYRSRYLCPRVQQVITSLTIQCHYQEQVELCL